MSVTSCDRGWAPSSAGPQHLTLRNTDSRPGELQLVGDINGLPEGAGRARTTRTGLVSTGWSEACGTASGRQACCVP